MGLFMDLLGLYITKNAQYIYISLFIEKPVKTTLKIIWAQDLYKGLDINIFTRRRYLRVYIDMPEVQSTWIGVKVDDWESGVRTLAGVARQQP